MKHFNLSAIYLIVLTIILAVDAQVIEIKASLNDTGIKISDEGNNQSKGQDSPSENSPGIENPISTIACPDPKPVQNSPPKQHNLLPTSIPLVMPPSNPTHFVRLKAETDKKGAAHLSLSFNKEKEPPKIKVYPKDKPLPSKNKKQSSRKRKFKSSNFVEEDGSTEPASAAPKQSSANNNKSEKENNAPIEKKPVPKEENQKATEAKSAGDKSNDKKTEAKTSAPTKNETPQQPEAQKPSPKEPSKEKPETKPVEVAKEVQAKKPQEPKKEESGVKTDKVVTVTVTTTKTEAPVKPKVEESVKPKIEESVKPKTKEPVKCKSEEPVKPKSVEPVKAKKEEPVKPKLEEPVKTKVEEPAKHKKEEPVESKKEEVAVLEERNADEILATADRKDDEIEECVTEQPIYEPLEEDAPAELITITNHNYEEVEERPSNVKTEQPKAKEEVSQQWATPSWTSAPYPYNNYYQNYQLMYDNYLKWITENNPLLYKKSNCYPRVNAPESVNTQDSIQALSAPNESHSVQDVFYPQPQYSNNVIDVRPENVGGRIWRTWKDTEIKIKKPVIPRQKTLGYRRNEMNYGAPLYGAQAIGLNGYYNNLNNALSYSYPTYRYMF